MRFKWILIILFGLFVIGVVVKVLLCAHNESWGACFSRVLKPAKKLPLNFYCDKDDRCESGHVCKPKNDTFFTHVTGAADVCASSHGYPCNGKCLATTGNKCNHREDCANWEGESCVNGTCQKRVGAGGLCTSRSDCKDWETLVCRNGKCEELQRECKDRWTECANPEMIKGKLCDVTSSDFAHERRACEKTCGICDRRIGSLPGEQALFDTKALCGDSLVQIRSYKSAEDAYGSDLYSDWCRRIDPKDPWYDSSNSRGSASFRLTCGQCDINDTEELPSWGMYKLMRENKKNRLFAPIPTKKRDE